MEQHEIIHRKRTRLESYDYGENGAYFVTICVQDRAPLLSNIQSCKEEVSVRLTTLGCVVKEYISGITHKYPDVIVDSSVIMPDHIHILLRIDAVCGDTEIRSKTLGSVIGWFKYQTTKECNRIRNMPGEKLWQRSYFDHVIRNFTDYQDTWQYIENNPRKWVLDRNMM